MKKLRQKLAKKDKKKESSSKKRGSNSPASKAPTNRRRTVKEICRDELPKIDQKFKDLERVMNDKFSEVLKSLQQKNKIVEKDDGIEKLSDIVVEEMQPLDSIISGGEHDMTSTIYKPPPKTLDEYMISDTAILSAFLMPKKDVSDDKKTPAPHSRKPSKIYRSLILTHFGSSSKGKENSASKEQKKYPFKGYDIIGDSPNVEMEIFDEWINDGLYKQHMKKKDKDDHYKVNCSTLGFHQLDFLVAFPKYKNWF
ncbi:hypothetical protein BC332_25224 [Capsicum chinense]|nr:hypothetical protein BC332_25224 [Capsicum chinense]